jgi:hypothetical protein
MARVGQLLFIEENKLAGSITSHVLGTLIKVISK